MAFQLPQGPTFAGQIAQQGQQSMQQAAQIKAQKEMQVIRLNQQADQFEKQFQSARDMDEWNKGIKIKEFDLLRRRQNHAMQMERLQNDRQVVAHDEATAINEIKLNGLKVNLDREQLMLDQEKKQQFVMEISASLRDATTGDSYFFRGVEQKRETNQLFSDRPLKEGGPEYISSVHANLPFTGENQVMWKNDIMERAKAEGIKITPGEVADLVAAGEEMQSRAITLQYKKVLSASINQDEVMARIGGNPDFQRHTFLARQSQIPMDQDVVPTGPMQEEEKSAFKEFFSMGGMKESAAAAASLLLSYGAGAWSLDKVKSAMTFSSKIANAPLDDLKASPQKLKILDRAFPEVMTDDAARRMKGFDKLFGADEIPEVGSKVPLKTRQKIFKKMTEAASDSGFITKMAARSGPNSRLARGVLRAPGITKLLGAVILALSAAGMTAYMNMKDNESDALEYHTSSDQMQEEFLQATTVKERKRLAGNAVKESLAQ